MRAQAAGRLRAAFWAILGYPNLVKARAVLAEKRGIAKLAAERPDGKLRLRNNLHNLRF